MKQKYLISRNDEKNKLTIKEFAELEKQNEYTLLCEETYSGQAIKSAITKGKQALISTLRTTNLYPPALYAEKIAEVIMSLFSSESDQSVKLFFDDKDFFSKELEKPEDVDDIESKPGEFDELLAEEPDEFNKFRENDNAIKNTTSPIQISENGMLDIEEES